MKRVAEKSIVVPDGEMRYDRWKNPDCPFDILFVHGLGDNKKWFLPQFESHCLDAYSWVVPDLLGHGKSAKPQRQDSYTMENQAECLMAIVKEEGIRHLVILAHSMGGPISVSLLERLSRQTGIQCHALFYLEGNLDINDAYLSGKFARYTFEEYVPKFHQRLEKIKVVDRDLYNDMKEMGPLPYWASSVDLVRISRSQQLLPRLQKQNNLKTYFIFGARNRGRFSSEDLIKDADLPLDYIPDAGHMMYRDNPDIFWELISTRLKPLGALAADNSQSLNS